MVRITRIEPAQETGAARKKVAAYCRVSTDSDEQMESLEAQKEHYMQVITSREDWDFAGIFYDEGVSGTGTEGRDGFKHLVQECRRGHVQLVITKSISRFSRNTSDLLQTVRELSRLGVGVLFERENINTLEMEGEFMLSILGGMAQDESSSMSENIRWSVQKRFMEGSFVVSTPPYGYRKEGKTMVPDPETAPVAKEIFSLYLGGWGCDRIANDLNHRGIRPPRGERWNASTISNILRNETYVGDLKLQKTFRDDRFKAHENKGERPQYVVRDHHEALISREDFMSVSQVKENNRAFRNLSEGSSKCCSRYPMTGKVICSCGHPLIRKVIRSPLGERVSWACSLHLRDSRSCDTGYIQDISLRNAVMTMRNKLIFARREVLGPVSAALEKDCTVAAGIRAIDSELEENLRSRQRLRELLGKGFLEPAVFAQENCTLLEKSKTLTDERARLEASVAEREGKVAAIRDLLRYLRNAESETEFNDAFFLSHVELIKVLSENRVAIRLKCGLELKEEI